jgi:hypothetical protein
MQEMIHAYNMKKSENSNNTNQFLNIVPPRITIVGGVPVDEGIVDDGSRNVIL